MGEANKKTLREIIDDRALMSMLSRTSPERGLPDGWLEYINAKRGQTPEHRYDVQISVDGFRLDWNDFIARIGEQLDRMLSDRAQELIDRLIAPILTEMSDIADAATELKAGIRRKAAELLGYGPQEVDDWKDPGS